jgi:hypothetical protein
MKYTGLNPTDVNRVASGSLGVFVESTQVGTFGTDSLVISGSTLLSGSLINIGPQTNQGNLTVTGSTILSSSLSVIGTETVTGTSNTVGTLLVTGSATISSSINVIGTESILGALLVTGSTTLSGSLSNIGPIGQTGTLTVAGNTVITGSTTVSSSLNVIGTQTVNGLLNTIGSFITTGSAIISSSLSVIGTGAVTGVLQSIGSFFATGSAIISSSLSVIGQSTVVGTSTISGSSLITGSLTVQGPAVITGSALITGSANIQGNTGINGTLSVTGSEYTSGSTDVTTIQGSTAGGNIFNVLGTSGQLFSVTDGLSGSLFSVNTISGLPLMEIFSDETINIGRFGVSPLKTVGALAQVTGSLTGSVSGQAIGPFVATGSSNVLSVQGTGLEATIFDVNGPSGQLFSVVDGLSGSLFSVNTISGVPVMEAFSDNTIRLGQYSNPPLIITGATASVSGSLNVNSGNINVTSGSVSIFRSGSASPSDALFDVEGAQGQLFSVIDSFSGSLMSVNDISGFPILDVRSDDTITMGTFGSNALVVSGSAVIIGVTASAAPTVTGSNGQIQFAVVGGNAFIYAWLGGRWRSGSLA